MLYKLNSEPIISENKCSVSMETSGNQIPVDTVDLKRKVSNYKKVLIDDFEIPENVFFNTIPINANHIRSFITDNGSDLAGVRIYFAKRTNDPAKDDYQLIFVPCKEVSDGSGGTYYEDTLGTEINKSIISVECRTPPGCQKGALLLTP